MWDGSRAVKTLEAGQTRVRMWPEMNRAEWPYFMTFVSQCLPPESIRTLDPQPGEGYEETFGSPDLNLVGCGPAWVSLGGGGRLPLLMEKPWGGCLLVALEAQAFCGPPWALLLCTIFRAGILSPQKAEMVLCAVFCS